jgi:hypothetical protein
MTPAIDNPNPFVSYPAIFWQLLSGPWTNLDVAWGVIPMYMSLILGELYEPKPSPKNAVQGGANLLWAGIDWGRVSLMPLLIQILDRWYALPANQRLTHIMNCLKPAWQSANSIIVTTTVLTIWLGLASILVGIRKKKLKMWKFFRYGRFSCYLCIMLYPLQTQVVPWSEHGWNAVGTIAAFSVPVWLLLTFVFQVLLKLK